MPSPFPGMDPYLEGDLWESFHGPFATEIATQLNRDIPAGYWARVERRMTTVSLTSSGSSRRPRRPDVSVVRETVTGHYATAVAKPPLHLVSVTPETLPHYAVKIIRDRNRELVTAIELLSPANKRGQGRADYLAKRNEYLSNPVHLIEIDLLHEGQRLPMVDPLPDAPYIVILHREEPRPLADVWPILLSDPLPVIRVPLREGDLEPVLDLQSCFSTVFDEQRFGDEIDYDSPPPVTMSTKEITFAKGLLRSNGHSR